MLRLVFCNQFVDDITDLLALEGIIGVALASAVLKDIEITRMSIQDTLKGLTRVVRTIEGYEEDWGVQHYINRFLMNRGTLRFKTNNLHDNTNLLLSTML